MSGTVHKIVGGDYDGRIVVRLNNSPFTRHIIIATPKEKSVLGVFVITDKNNRPMNKYHKLCDELIPCEIPLKILFNHLNKSIKKAIGLLMFIFSMLMFSECCIEKRVDYSNEPFFIDEPFFVNCTHQIDTVSLPDTTIIY